MPDIFEFASIIAKFFLYISVLTAVGTVLIVPIFHVKSMNRLIVIMVVIAFLASFALYGIDAIMLTGDFSGLTDPEILFLLSETASGEAFYMRMAGLSLLLTGLLISLVFNKLGKCLPVIGVLITLYSFTQVGHMTENNSIAVSFSLFIHLLTAGLWIGILLPLKNMALNENCIHVAAEVAHRFGQLAIIFVPVLILAGSYMAWVTFDNIEELITTSYGKTLLIKIFAVSIILIVAAYNKLRFVPELREGKLDAAINLAKTINAEWAVVAFILLTTSILTTVANPP